MVHFCLDFTYKPQKSMSNCNRNIEGNGCGGISGKSFSPTKVVHICTQI